MISKNERHQPNRVDGVTVEFRIRGNCPLVQDNMDNYMRGPWRAKNVLTCKMARGKAHHFTIFTPGPHGLETALSDFAVQQMQ